MTTEERLAEIQGRRERAMSVWAGHFPFTPAEELLIRNDVPWLLELVGKQKEERISWRRVAERLEEEKVQLQERVRVLEQELKKDA